MSTKWETFHSAYNKVTQKLKAESKIDEISKEFSAFNSDKDRVKYALSLDAVKECIQPCCLVQEKSVDHSLSFKATGNTAYRAQEFRDAVQLYTDSIAWAPTTANGGGDTLSLAYGNRSAALFQLGKHEACVRDIDRAILDGYPSRLMYKVLQRKATSLMNLKMFDEAESFFKEAASALELSEVKEKQREKLNNEMQQSINKCHLEESETFETAEDAVLANRGMPELSSPNALYPSLSDACSVEYTEDQGRHIIAKRDIGAGEVVLVEKPFASVLLRSNYSYHCHHCLIFTIDAVPCPDCPDARFCSTECRQAALNTYHRHECSIMNAAHHGQLNKFSLLALRTITKLPFSYIKDYKAQVGQSQNTNTAAAVYASDDYSTIHKLVTHDSDRPIQDLFQRTLTAVYLLKLLQQSTYFGDENPDDDHLAFIGGLMLSHLQSFPCNAHEVPELYLEPQSVDISMPNEVGAGIYSTLSLFNHSCDPGVNRNFYADVCVVRAIRPIQKGEQVSDNYGAVYATHPLKDRQEKLKPQYFFQCQCSACNNNWPLYNDIPIDEPEWKCSKCYKRLTSEACCGVKYNLAAMKKNFNESEVLFRSAFGDLLNCNVNKALPIFLHHLALIQEMVVLPWRQFNDCQEALKQCYSIMGNCNMSSSMPNGNIF